MRTRIQALLSLALSIPMLLSTLSANAEVKAFPTAEGFGANTLGGRGGRAIEVTNLDDTGDGSLRACAEATGPRTCIFRVSGTISLSKSIRIGEENSFVTIAGQTSPGGIQLKGGGIVVMEYGHDVIVRHLRIRPGAIPDPQNPGSYLAQDTNAFIAYGNEGKTVHDIIIDHCSLEWSTDQNGPDAWGPAKNYTAQWNLTAEGTTVGNSKGAHNMGLIVGASTETTYSIHHSVMAHCHGRNPLISQSGIVDFRNNVIYDWAGNNALVFGSWVYESGDPSFCPNGGCGSSAFGNIVNNLYLPGPGYNLTTTFWLNNVADGSGVRVDGSPAERGGTKVYVSGNWSPQCPQGCPDDWDNGYMSSEPSAGSSTTFDQVPTPAEKARAPTPFGVPDVTTDPTSDLQDKVLASAGATKPKRDEVDARIVNDVINRTGGYASSDEFVGGPWPDLETGAPTAPTDSDHDGMPDEWEISFGLDPNDELDGAKTADNGYTNLENYLNDLAGDPVPGFESGSGGGGGASAGGGSGGDGGSATNGGTGGGKTGAGGAANGADAGSGDGVRGSCGCRVLSSDGSGSDAGAWLLGFVVAATVRARRRQKRNATSTRRAFERRSAREPARETEPLQPNAGRRSSAATPC